MTFILSLGAGALFALSLIAAQDVQIAKQIATSRLSGSWRMG